MRQQTHLSEVLTGGVELRHQRPHEGAEGAQQGFVGAVSEGQVSEGHASVPAGISELVVVHVYSGSLTLLFFLFPSTYGILGLRK